MKRSAFDENTGNRKGKPVTLAEARERLAIELDRLGAASPVLSSNIELRIDGQPRSDRREPADPGVAVYFSIEKRPIVLACDSFADVAQNIAAVAAHIDAMRRMERYGVGTTEQMFTGFLALPAPMVIDDWRTPLGNPSTLAEAEHNFRERARVLHAESPDGSGNQARMAQLTAAISTARKVLK